MSLLLACADPSAVALALCAQSPGLYEDESGQTLLQGWLSADAWQEASPTLGHSRAGGRDALRGATCQVTSAEGGNITLVREQTSFGIDGVAGHPSTVTLDWIVDGDRVDIGLSDALALRSQADEALSEGNLPVFVGRWESLAASFPDPLLAVDHAEATLVLERTLYRRKLVPLPERIDSGALVGFVENRGDRDVTAVTVLAEFEGVETEVLIAAVPAGGKTPLTVPIPEGHDGGYRLTVSACSF